MEFDEVVVNAGLRLDYFDSEFNGNRICEPCKLKSQYLEFQYSDYGV